MSCRHPQHRQKWRSVHWWRGRRVAVLLAAGCEVLVCCSPQRNHNVLFSPMHAWLSPATSLEGLGKTCVPIRTLGKMGPEHLLVFQGSGILSQKGNASSIARRTFFDLAAR